MIITCPSCTKKYLLEAATFPETGRQVRCGECATVWWQEALEILTLDPQKEGVVENAKKSHSLNPRINNYDRSFEEEEQPRGIKAFIHRFYLDWIIIILAFVIIAYVLYQERATLFEHAPSLKQALNTKMKGKQSTSTPGFTVQNLNYDATHHNNVPHLAITGELVNISAKTIPVPSLVITISGKNGGQDMPTKSHKWNHANKNEQLLPGGRLVFQSLTPHPGWSTIDKIDVSY